MKYWIQLNYNLQLDFKIYKNKVFYLWWIRPDFQSTVKNLLHHY
jgi:hypothetical protein